MAAPTVPPPPEDDHYTRPQREPPGLGKVAVGWAGLLRVLGTWMTPLCPLLQVTGAFELYMCYSPLGTKASAVSAIHKLMRWIRQRGRPPLHPHAPHVLMRMCVESSPWAYRAVEAVGASRWHWPLCSPPCCSRQQLWGGVCIKVLWGRH